MLKYRSKIKKDKAYSLGSRYVAEWQIYVPRGRVNAAYFNIYLTTGETEQFILTQPIPVVELQIVRNHLAKQKGEAEWEVEWLYNAGSIDWLALGLTDPNEVVRSYTDKFITLVQGREDEFAKKMEEAKTKRAAARELKKKEKEEAQRVIDLQELNNMEVIESIVS